MVFILESSEVFDLTKRILKRHGKFLISMYHNDGCTLKKISKESGIQYQHISGIVKDFEKIDWVEKRICPKKKKKIILIYLTPLGKDIAYSICNANHMSKYGKRLGNNAILVDRSKFRDEIDRRRRKDKKSRK